MNMTRYTIIKGGIPDYLWTEIVLAMVHVKNIRPTHALSGKSPYEFYESKPPSLNHLRVLGSTVYVLIHKEERRGINSKSAKFSPRAQRGILCGYDGCTIYRVYLERITGSSGSSGSKIYAFIKTPSPKTRPKFLPMMPSWPPT